MLAVYIGLFLNGAVLFRRVEGYFEHLTVRNGIFAAIEVFGSILATFFLLRLLSLFGRRTWQVLASLVVIISAAASYYMTFMNVVIGYGIVASVMTTDIDLSKEVVGQGFILWTILTCLIPLFFIWSNTCRYTLLRQLRTRGQRIRNVAVVVGSLRKDSVNRKVAQALAALTPNLKFTFVAIGDLPHFDQDLESDPPAQWVRFFLVLVTGRWVAQSTSPDLRSSAVRLSSRSTRKRALPETTGVCAEPNGMSHSRAPVFRLSATVREPTPVA